MYQVCTNIRAKTKQQSASKPLPNLKKASIMPWDVLGEELITLTLPKSGVARTVCYVDCFVQLTTNTKRAYQ